MNVLVLSSWYPTPEVPYAGIFVSDQVHALLRHREDVRLLVAWPDIRPLTPRRPWESCKALFSSRDMEIRDSGAGLLECRFPVLEWSPKLPGGVPNGALRRWKRAWRVIREEWGMPDVIHAHVGLSAGWLAAWCKEECGTPYVLTEHMSPFPFPSLLRHGHPVPELEQAYQAADKVIAVSPSLADDIRGYGLADPIVIPNVINESIFFPGENRPGQPFVFFFLGHLGEQKGADVLLDALGLWNPPVDVHCVMAGSATQEQEQAFLQRVRELGLQDRVKWMGPLERNEVAQQMRQAHVFVLPSRHESFGVVLVEALACGLPVISTRCGGPEFIVGTSNIGTLVDVGDARGLAATMRRFYAEYGRFSTAEIANYYRTRFSAESTAGKIFSIYRRIIDAYQAREMAY